jgi:hypothetical protein
MSSAMIASIQVAGDGKPGSLCIVKICEAKAATLEQSSWLDPLVLSRILSIGMLASPLGTDNEVTVLYRYS